MRTFPKGHLSRSFDDHLRARLTSLDHGRVFTEQYSSFNRQTPQLNASADITAFTKCLQSDLYLDFFKHSAEASAIERYESSAIDMIMHVVRDESITISDWDVSELLLSTAERRRQLKQQMANIDAFESFVRESLGDRPQHIATQKKVRFSSNARENYWTRVRGDLQTWFSISLEDLSKVIGVAKATLVYIDKPSRIPRPSTARKVMDLHALAFAIVEATGIDNAREWLSTKGIAALHDGGVRMLDRAVSTYLYDRRSSSEAIGFSAEEDMQPDAGPFTAPIGMEAEAF